MSTTDLTQPPRPVPLPVQADAVPADLCALRRFVIWWYEWAGKWTKVPYIATHPTGRASSTNPATWRSFDEARAAYEDGKGDGLGIVLGDGLVGIDLDNCRHPKTREFAPSALAIVRVLNSYTEISPSGYALHVLARGALPPGRRKKGVVEMYAEGRYFTLTGQHLANTPTTIEERTDALAKVHRDIFGTNGHGARRPHTTAHPPATDLDDATLLACARRASNGAKFSALWAGDVSEYPSASEADLAFCNLLAFWTNRDAARMDTLFRQSGLMREKWDARRGDRPYGQHVINKAIEDCRETYQSESRQVRRARQRREQKTADAGVSIDVNHADDRLTEAGAAERFTRLHGDDVRFDYRRNRWLRWDGHRWIPDADAAVTRLALDFTRTWQRQAVEIPDADRREKVFKTAIRLERRDALQSLLTFAAALKPIADAGDAWDHDPLLMGVVNGAVDLRTGTWRPGRREDRLTMSTAVPFDPDATCPRWTQFLTEIFAGDDPLIRFVQLAVGYSILGLTSEQCLFLLYGTGANGKGTFTNTLKFVFGDYAWNMPFATIEMRDRAAIPNDLAALVGRRFIIASETNDGTRLNEARLKALSGCDPITARFLHQEFFTFEPVGKFWLAVNHKPIVRDDSPGFWRRIRLIPFTQAFPINKALADELRAEAVGILAWAVRGCLAWQQDGLHPPAIIIEATREYEEDSDTLAPFRNEAIEPDPDAEVGARELYEHYRRWAMHHGVHERDLMKVQMFGRKMSERFRSRKNRTTNIKCYLGIARKGVF